MYSNLFGNNFGFLSFGESHGTALGAVIEGCPAGLDFDLELLRERLRRRRPGGALVSGRSEADEPELLSGVHEGRTLGTPIAIIVRNVDARSGDYKQIASSPRAGHADDVWKSKFGHSDPRGGGRSSGRETVARVMAGAVAEMLLRRVAPAIEVVGFAESLGPERLSVAELERAKGLSVAEVDACVARFPSSAERQSAVEKLLSEAKAQGRSYGGRARVVCRGVPSGLGQPVFHKLKADFAAALMSVGATIGFDIGVGDEAADAEGSSFHRQGEAPYGGVRGGISTGEPLEFRVAFKPTSSVMDVAKQGRHDPCIVPRAIPVLEAMSWIVLADHVLWARLDRC